MSLKNACSVKHYALVSSKGTVRAWGTIYQIAQQTGLKTSTLYWYISADAARRRSCPQMVECEEPLVPGQAGAGMEKALGI